VPAEASTLTPVPARSRPTSGLNTLTSVSVLLLVACLPLLSADALATKRGGGWESSYEATLRALCDALLSTQITNPADPNRGALVCPSINPEKHPLHSRAAEAVYPLAVLFQRTGAARYRDASLLLGRWLFGRQRDDGGWVEETNGTTGWTGTTADQLISLAGAYSILKSHMPAADRPRWERSIRAAADFVARTFPRGNVNYQPTGAVALALAAEALGDPSPAWRKQADALIAATVAGINADDLLTGEGEGVDPGYNLAQSIGFLALYGRLTGDETLRDRAADVLRAHLPFIYPNGSVDNSWGTRSFKWTYESGTKTAPGVYFSFALLGDRDPRFASAGLLCWKYLTGHSMRRGLVIAGPGERTHADVNPPCLYSTFARAQSLAMALAYAPKGGAAAADGRGRATGADRMASAAGWFHWFKTVNVVVVRTRTIMATVSAYGAASRYGLGQVTRGGSVTNLWMEGFGRSGFAQTSSVSVYKREEALHMPDEAALRPLTPRVECTIGGELFSNLFESAATMTVAAQADHVVVISRGRLHSVTGAASDVEYTITHRFYRDRWTRQYSLASPTRRSVRIVEPFVREPGLEVKPVAPRLVELRPKGGRAWRFSVEDGPADLTVDCGAESDRYWSPFPAIECYPVVVVLATTPNESVSLTEAFAPAP
jgi:hypothetical protein